MAKKAYIGVADNIAKKIRRCYIGAPNGVDASGNTLSINRKIKKIYLGDDNNKARLVFTNGVAWHKYDCKVYNYYEYERNSEGIGDESVIDGAKWNSHTTSYDFDSSRGFYGTGSSIKGEDLGLGDVTTEAYFLSSYRVLQLIRIEESDFTSDVINEYYKYIYKVVDSASARLIDTSYSKGSTSYGIIYADENKAPESGRVEESSAKHYVIYHNSNYYWYELVEENNSSKNYYNITYDYTTYSSFGPDYAQGFRISEFTPSGDEVNQDPSWKGYTVGNTIHMYCEDGVADISKYVIEWYIYNADQTYYRVFARNDYEATFIMPPYDVKIEVKVIYQGAPEHTSHNYTIPVGSGEASCTEQAYVIYKCDSCEDTYTEWGEGPLGHDWCNESGVCTRDGCGASHTHRYDENNTCTICYYNPQAECNHEGYWSYWIPEDSGHWRYCQNCGYQDTGYLHDQNTTEDNKDGTHTIKCSVCGYEHRTESCNYTNDSALGATDEYHICTACGGTENHKDWTPYKADGSLDSTYHYCRVCRWPEEHDWIVEDELGEICSKCGILKVDACAANGGHYYPEEWTQHATEHVKTCTYCGHTITGAHIYTATKEGCTETQHKMICSVCGYHGGWNNHEMQLSADGSFAQCTKCGYFVDYASEGSEAWSLRPNNSQEL